MNVGFEQAKVAAAETGDFGGAHFRDDGGEFTGRQLGDGLEIAAVFVAKREIVEEVFNGFKTARLQHGGARRAYAFQVGQG